MRWRKSRRRRARRSRLWLILLLGALPLAAASSLRSLPAGHIVLKTSLSQAEYERSKLYKFPIFKDGGVDSVQPGDILLGRCAGSPVPSLHPEDNWTHAAIYVGNGLVVEAANPEENVLKRRLADWQYPRMTWVSYVRINDADENIRRLAVSFALEQVGKPYDLNWLSKQADGNSWYCSEMVWAAYLYASDGAIDLAGGSGLWGVNPDDLAAYAGATVVGGHYEFKPGTLWLSLFSWVREGLSALTVALLFLSVLGIARLWWWSRRTGLLAWEMPGRHPRSPGLPRARRAFHFPSLHADSYHMHWPRAGA